MEVSFLQIEYREISALIPYANNAKKHPPKQIQNLAESIRRFGFRNPVLIDSSCVIVAGHGRCLAAQAAGLTEVPVLIADDLSEDEIRAYRILDNKLAESPWDYEKLSLEMPTLDLSGFELKLHVDLNPVSPADFPDMALPEVQLSRVKRGQLWQLGKHRLLCGDSTSADDVQRLMRGDKATLLLTDPPYGVDYSGVAGSILNDDLTGGELQSFLTAAFSAARAAMIPGAAFFVWFAATQSYEFFGACRQAGLSIHQVLVWVKQRAVLSRSDFNYQTEACLYGLTDNPAQPLTEEDEPVDVRTDEEIESCLYGWTGGAAHRWFKDDKQTNVLRFDAPTRSEEHPTMKPLAMFVYLISCVTGADEIVLDLFGGSGTTLIACEQYSRRCRMMELDEHYCEVIISRWEQLTGAKAVLCEL